MLQNLFASCALPGPDGEFSVLCGLSPLA